MKVKQTWMDLYRAVDSQGNTLEFLLSATRDAEAAKRFFSKALAASHTMTPRVITVDKHAAYPKAFKELTAEGLFQNPVNGGPSSISTLSSSKTIVSSNDSSNLGWVSFHSSARGEPCKDRR